jgi:hypothetical protein
MKKKNILQHSPERLVEHAFFLCNKYAVYVAAILYVKKIKCRRGY